MRQSLLVVAALFAFVPLAVPSENVEDCSPPLAASDAEQPLAEFQGKPGDRAATQKNLSQPVSSGTWTFSSRENCFDLWMEACAADYVPGGGNLCVGSPAGLPCSAPDYCWHVIDPARVDLYVCQ